MWGCAVALIMLARDALQRRRTSGLGQLYGVWRTKHLCVSERTSLQVPSRGRKIYISDIITCNRLKDFKFIPFMFVTKGFRSQTPLFMAMFHGLATQKTRGTNPKALWVQETLNPQPLKTLNPKDIICRACTAVRCACLNPKPSTLNPKPSSAVWPCKWRNPQPQTLKP